MCYHKLSKRVLILLALDDKKNSNLNHRQIASALNTTVTTIVVTARDYFQNGLEHIPPDDIETAFEGETGASEGCSSLSTPAPPMQDNPNLVPIGHGFGFLVFIKDIEV